MRKRTFIGVSGILLVLVFVLWANLAGLVILIVSSDGHLSNGRILVEGGSARMTPFGGKMFGAFTTRLDRDIVFEASVDGLPRRVAFGYTTRGEFQINAVKLNSSGSYEVSHHSVP